MYCNNFILNSVLECENPIPRLFIFASFRKSAIPVYTRPRIQVLSTRTYRYLYATQYNYTVRTGTGTHYTLHMY